MSTRSLSSLKIFALALIGVVILHLPFLHLPFYWDEAGFYLPAAHDVAYLHALIPQTTMDAGHPPLGAAYLALWLSLAGWKPLVARLAMLLVAAFALTNVFLLARRIATQGVALASTITTALFPVFFVQSSLAHSDLLAAAFTLWGIRLVIEEKQWPSCLAFSLAVLSKETAIITPLAFFLWDLLFQKTSGSNQNKLASAALRLVPAVPLFGWLVYHHHVTGYFFANSEIYLYNTAQALDPLRFAVALVHRSWHLLGTMNLAALTVATAVAMSFPAAKDASGLRDRIAIPIQLQFLLIILAHAITFSLLGGALLTRYLLSAYPLVSIICVSTLHRRIARWQWPVAVIILLFGLALFFDPIYKFAPEDNLRYRDYVKLHLQAAKFLQQHEQTETVLTAYVAGDELTRPYLGYTTQPFKTVLIKNFSAAEMLKARQMRSQYQVAYIFSTRYKSPARVHFDFWDRLDERFFDDYTDIGPDQAAEMLGGRVVYVARSRAEWVAVIELQLQGVSVHNFGPAPPGLPTIRSASAP